MKRRGRQNAKEFDWVEDLPDLRCSTGELDWKSATRRYRGTLQQPLTEVR